MSADLEKRSGWIYYGAIAVFVGILAFAILGLVRSSSVVGASPSGRADRDLSARPGPPSLLATGPQPTIAIPPPTAAVPTPPPSRTYIHPPPGAEAVYPDPAGGLRR